MPGKTASRIGKEVKRKGESVESDELIMGSLNGNALGLMT